MGLMHPAGLNVLPFVAQKILASMPTNNESARGSLVNRKSNYAQTRPLGNSFVPWVPKSEHLVGRQRKKEETRRKRFSGRIEHSQNRRSSATAYAREEQVTWSQVM